MGCLGRHTGSSLPYILSGSCSRAPTRLMTCEAGCSVSYSAKRWHTFSWDSVWLLATNPKILMGEESWGEESPGRHETGSWGTQPFPSPAPPSHPSPTQHLVMSSSLQPHALQHARLPCPSPTPRAYSNSCTGSGGRCKLSRMASRTPWAWVWVDSRSW